MINMRVLSLYQPWASLVMGGYKQIETRSWKTSFRGPVIIHASKHFTMEEALTCVNEPFRTRLVDMGYTRTGDLPLGACLGIVLLRYCVPTESIREAITGQERAFGNYNPGRFGWVFDNRCRTPFPTPVGFRGRPGLFTITIEDTPDLCQMITGVLPEELRDHPGSFTCK